MAEVWVEIWHPEVEGTATRTLSSFKSLHESNGWQIVEDEPESATGSALTVHAWDEDEAEEDEISDD